MKNEIQERGGGVETRRPAIFPPGVGGVGVPGGGRSGRQGGDQVPLDLAITQAWSVLLCYQWLACGQHQIRYRADGMYSPALGRC